MSPEMAIEVNGVSRRFGDLVAVDDLSFEVERGEIFGLLGPNGAGKTTTINLILGLLAAQAGSITVLGMDVSTQTRQIYRQVGYVPQESNLYQDLSAEDNLWHHAALYCQDLSSVPRRMEQLLVFTQLWDRRKDPVRTFSGGMKRRLALARALLHEPQVIFFDEPTLGVDVQGRIALWDRIQEERANGRTFIVSTNNMEEADKLCDRLLIMDHGRTIALDTPDNLKSAMRCDVVSLRTSPALQDPAALLADFKIQNLTQRRSGEIRFEMQGASDRTAELIERLSQEHQLDSLLIARPSLDDVFLYHTGRALRE